MDDFQIFVKPVSDACNLDCSYCYYREKSGVQRSGVDFRMSDDILEEYIQQHIAASAGTETFFSWHGGEPTLAGLDFYKRVVSLQKQYLPYGRRVINGIQTNGTLLNEEWCQFFQKQGFVVGISLDGPEEVHSRNRVRSNGKSSFHEVIKGIDLLQQYQVPHEILCVVNPDNVESPLSVYRFFKELKISCITFLPLVEHQNGKPSERCVNAKSFGEFLCSVFDEWKENDIGSVKIQIIEEALRTAFGAEHSLCVFKKICGRVPVVESNGNFYSCDHFMNSENLIGNIRFESLQDLLNNPAQISFGKRKQSSLPQSCLNCEVLEMCNGACPKDRFLSTPQDEPGLNYLCEGYKRFFLHVKPFAQLVAEVWKAGQQ